MVAVALEAMRSSNNTETLCALLAALVALAGARSRYTAPRIPSSGTTPRTVLFAHPLHAVAEQLEVLTGTRRQGSKAQPCSPVDREALLPWRLVTEDLFKREILAELRAINARLARLENVLPTVDRTWLTPAEMSKICGVSPRTLQSYVKTNRLGPASFKREMRGKTFNYRYHRELVLRDLGLA